MGHTSGVTETPESPAAESELRAKLRGEIMPATWQELIYQFARGGLLLARGDVDLLEVAEAVARDDRAEVERLVREGRLWRARSEDAQRFEQAKSQRFQFVILQPWVLAQAL